MLPSNQVGLRLLFGGDHLVEDVTDIARQDDILQRDGAHTHAERLHLTAHVGRHGLVDVRLIGEYLFERAFSERLAHRDLQRAVQILACVFHG